MELMSVTCIGIIFYIFASTAVCSSETAVDIDIDIYLASVLYIL